MSSDISSSPTCFERAAACWRSSGVRQPWRRRITYVSIALLSGTDPIGLPARDALRLVGAAAEQIERFVPRHSGGRPPLRASVEIALLEVDPAVAPRDAGLCRRIGEGRPFERQLLGRNRSRLDP